MHSGVGGGRRLEHVGENARLTTEQTAVHSEDLDLTVFCDYREDDVPVLEMRVGLYSAREIHGRRMGNNEEAQTSGGGWSKVRKQNAARMPQLASAFLSPPPLASGATVLLQFW